MNAVGMKKNVLLYGRPGVGKTTLVRRVVERLPVGMAAGFYTQELRQDGIRRGFEVIALDGGRGLLAHVDKKSRYRVGKYGVDLPGFEAVALPAIAPAGVSIIVIDEIGKMECFSAEFRRRTLVALDSAARVLAAVPLQGNAFVAGLKTRPDVTLLEVSKANRDELVERLVTALLAEERPG
jgi:nucleoside-triphosphatase